MRFSFFDVIVLIGVIQGLIVSTQMFVQKPRTSNPVLPWVLLVTVVLNCKILLHTLGLWNTTSFRYFPLAFDLAIQPLLYLYVISITQAQRSLGRLAFIHLALPILFMIHAISVYIQVLPLADLSLKAQMAARFDYNQVKEIEDYLSILSFIGYGYLSFRQLRIYRRWLNDAISDASYPTYSWLRNLLLFMGGLTVLLMVNVILDYGFGYGQTSFLHWQIFYLFLTIMIYYVGFKGYRQTVFPRLPDAAVSLKSPPLELIPANKVESIREAILQMINEEKIYLDPTLTVTELARRLDLSANVVSYAIGQSFGKSFRDLINEYRVEEVKLRLVDPTLAHLSILGVALDSGFNSEASFYRVFKKHTDCSPKEFQSAKR